MNTPESMELYRRNLFEKTNGSMTQRQQERLIRLRGAYVHWVEFPMKSELELREFISQTFSIEKTQAYEDIQMVKMLMGNIQNAGKEWHRFRLIAMIEESYEMAKGRKDTKAMAMIIDKYGKYTQLHIPDQDQVPWEKIIPQLIEPTEDPTVVGLERDPEAREKARKLLEKYSNEISKTVKSVSVEDVEFIDLEDEHDKEQEENIFQ